MIRTQALDEAVRRVPALIENARWNLIFMGRTWDQYIETHIPDLFANLVRAEYRRIMAATREG